METSPADQDSAKDRPRSRGKALSELLNALDGIPSHVVRLPMLTTNHIDYLDKALVRGESADKKIDLPHAEAMIFPLFCMVFK
jgi:ATP-dependent 26S proteasome regulatory subunit